MQNVNIQELLEVGIDGKAAPDTTEQYLKRLERELHLVLLLQLAVAKVEMEALAQLFIQVALVVVVEVIMLIHMQVVELELAVKDMLVADKLMLPINRAVVAEALALLELQELIQVLVVVKAVLVFHLQ
jgi:hypothetical protein